MSGKERFIIRAVAVVASVIIHVAAISAIPSPSPDGAAPYIELAAFDSDDREIDYPDSFTEPPPEPDAISPPEEQLLPDPAEKEVMEVVRLPLPPLVPQIVDLGAPSPDDEKPEQARFLSERDMKTDRESLKPSEARTGSPGDAPDRKKAELEKPTMEDADNTRQVAAKEDRRGGARDLPPSREARPAKAESKSGPASRRRSSSQGLEREPGHGEEKTEVQIAKKGVTSLESQDLMVGMADVKKSFDSDDGSVDFVPGVPRGEITALNAKAYTHAAFFNRAKKIIKFYWEPAGAVESVSWGGQALETQLMIVTDKDGNLISVTVTRSSGYAVVDQAAVRAVHRATPFYNIPPALLDEDGFFRYQLGFVIYQ